jgi:dipeptide/tripeptide permease
LTFDDASVDEVRRGVKACHVSLWLPIFWLAYGPMTSTLVSQASPMKLNGVPNGIVHNLNPITLLIMIPIFDKFIYPRLVRIAQLYATEEDLLRFTLRHAQYDCRCSHTALHLCEVALRKVSRDM